MIVFYSSMYTHYHSSYLLTHSPLPPSFLPHLLTLYPSYLFSTPPTCSHTLPLPPSFLPHLLTLYPSYLFSTPPTCSHTPPPSILPPSLAHTLPLLLAHTLPLPPSSLLSPSLACTLLTPSLTAFFPPSPKSDTCKTCDSMKTKLESEKDPDTIRCLQGQWDLHKRKAGRAYHQLREDTAQCQGSLDMDVITFDLQQSLPTPLLTVNAVYYKRQLWTYNLSVHCCGTVTPHYMGLGQYYHIGWEMVPKNQLHSPVDC